MKWMKELIQEIREDIKPSAFAVGFVALCTGLFYLLLCGMESSNPHIFSTTWIIILGAISIAYLFVAAVILTVVFLLLWIFYDWLKGKL